MDPKAPTGFQSKYFYDSHFRRNAMGRELAEEEFIKKTSDAQKTDKSPPKQEGQKPPPEKTTTQKLDKLVEQSKAPLLKIQTAVPLNPFPNKVIVDINKVTIIYKYFFLSKQVHSVFVKDISDVLVETSLFYATLKIIDVGYTDNSIDINHLSTEDAVHARKVIQGLIVAHKHGLDLSKIETANLVEKLAELGKAEKYI
jgi:hypothetical protein